MFASASLPLLLLLEAQAASTAPPAPPAIAPPPITIAPPPSPPPPRSAAVRPPEAIGAAGWITSDDYPVAARAALAEGRTTVRYEVRPDGRVGACTVIGPSGHADLDGASCTLLRMRARFRPARDTAGRPVSHMARQTIVWRLPEEVEAMPLVPGQVVLVLPMWRDNGQLGCDLRPSRPELDGLADDLCVAFYPDDAGSLPPIRIVAAVALGDAPLPPSRPSAEPRLESDELRFEVGGDGRVRNCASASPPGSAGGRLVCEVLQAAGHPYFLSAGSAVVRRARMRFDVYRPIAGPRAPAR
ncbi:MAG: periplasmic protein TonB [Sphingomonadales bacterium]|nr:periplasmic protein TonB [Sphingomonadales bacterium]